MFKYKNYKDDKDELRPPMDRLRDIMERLVVFLNKLNTNHFEVSKKIFLILYKVLKPESADDISVYTGKIYNPELKGIMNELRHLVVTVTNCHSVVTDIQNKFTWRCLAIAEKIEDRVYQETDQKLLLFKGKTLDVNQKNEVKKLTEQQEDATKTTMEVSALCRKYRL